MVEEFIMNTFTYHQAIRIFGIILIWAMIIDGAVARKKGETLLALIPLWFMILGSLLAFAFVGYVFAAIGLFATIYSIVYTIRKKAAEKTARNEQEEPPEP